MEATSLNIYANGQLLIVDWNYGQSVPEGILLTLNDMGLPNTVQGVNLNEKGRYLLFTLVPDLPTFSKAKLKILNKSGGLICTSTSKTKLKPFTYKELSKFSQISIIKILKALLRKVPLAYKDIESDFLNTICGQLSLPINNWYSNEEIYLAIPCLFTSVNQTHLVDVVVWKLVKGASDAYVKLQGFLYDNQIHLFLSKDFLHFDGVDQPVYVIEDAINFVIPFTVAKTKKLAKGQSVLNHLGIEAQDNSEIHQYFTRTIKKK